jgi:hypothetical protein
MVDLKHRLEIALSVERISCEELARKWKVSSPHVWRVAKDPKQSAPIHKKILAFIACAEKKLKEEILIKEAA